MQRRRAGAAMRPVARWGVRLAGGLVLLAVLGAYAEVTLRGRARIVSLETVPARPVAIVFGAAVYRDGRPSPVLADRVATAVALYRAGRVRGLLLSGDNRFADYNEPAAMAELARAAGVPADALMLDYAGRRTFDTCWRAYHIFGVRQAVLVTQRFHLPRALYLCRAVGLDAVGVPADRRPYRGAWWFGGVRETVARLRAWWDVHILPPSVVGGVPVPWPGLTSPTAEVAP